MVVVTGMFPTKGCSSNWLDDIDPVQVNAAVGAVLFRFSSLTWHGTIVDPLWRLPPSDCDLPMGLQLPGTLKHLK